MFEAKLSYGRVTHSVRDDLALQAIACILDVIVNLELVDGGPVNKASRRLARKRLDARLDALRLADSPHPPPRGWIRAIRDAIGMSSQQLANRMGVSPQAITGLEQSEANGTARLNTLERAAHALDATLVYAFVPNTTLEQMVETRARHIARQMVAAVDTTMRLEGQGTSADALEQAIEDVLERLNDRDLWRE